MKTYCVVYTPKGDYPDPRMIPANRQFVDDITRKSEAVKIARQHAKVGDLCVYVDVYDGEPDDRYAALVDYIRIDK